MEEAMKKEDGEDIAEKDKEGGKRGRKRRKERRLT